MLPMPGSRNELRPATHKGHSCLLVTFFARPFVNFLDRWTLLYRCNRISAESIGILAVRVCKRESAINCPADIYFKWVSRISGFTRNRCRWNTSVWASVQLTFRRTGRWPVFDLITWLTLNWLYLYVGGRSTTRIQSSQTILFANQCWGNRVTSSALLIIIIYL